MSVNLPIESTTCAQNSREIFETEHRLFTDTPIGLSDVELLRRYRAADTVARTLNEPIERFLHDWSPAHVYRFSRMADFTYMDGLEGHDHNRYPGI